LNAPFCHSLKQTNKTAEEGKRDQEFRAEGTRILAEVLEEGKKFEFETLM
jgi:hypothetical protein